MASNGRRILRNLLLAGTALLWLPFIWFLLPDRNVTNDVRVTLQQPQTTLPSSAGTTPLSLRLLSVTIPPRTANSGVLTLRDGADESTVDVTIGHKVTIDESEFDVHAIRAWGGLLHRPPGISMLNVAVHDANTGWIENVFVQRGSAQIVTPEIAVFADADAATPRPARWGVIEDGRTNWFSSFVPGTGLELGDGSIVTLLRRLPSGRILVETAVDDERSQVWVEANRYDPESSLVYEDPGAVTYRIEITLDEDDAATVTVVEGDLERWTRPAGIGAVLTDDESGLGVRVDQVERDAMPLFAEESPWLELVLMQAGRVVRIREGEAVRVGEITAVFEAHALPQPVRAQVLVGDVTVDFVESAEYEAEGWRISDLQALNDSEITLSAHHTDRRMNLRVGLTALAIAACAASIVVARRSR